MQSETADFAPGAAIRRTGRNMGVVFDSDLFALLRENTTSSTKREVHNVLHFCQRRTKLRLRITCRENLLTTGL